MFDNIKCAYQCDELTVWTCMDQEWNGYAGVFDNHKKHIVTGTVTMGPKVISKQRWG